VTVGIGYQQIWKPVHTNVYAGEEYRPCTGTYTAPGNLISFVKA
jgi:hypothetical protein